MNIKRLNQQLNKMLHENDYKMKAANDDTYKEEPLRNHVYQTWNDITNEEDFVVFTTSGVYFSVVSGDNGSDFFSTTKYIDTGKTIQDIINFLHR